MTRAIVQTGCLSAVLFVMISAVAGESWGLALATSFVAGALALMVIQSALGR